MELTKLVKRVESVEVVSATPWEMEGRTGVTYRGEFLGGTIKFASDESLSEGDIVALYLDAKFDQGGNITVKATVKPTHQKSQTSPKHKGE